MSRGRNNCAGNPQLAELGSFPNNAQVSGYVCGTAPFGFYSAERLSSCCSGQLYTVTNPTEQGDISYPASCLSWCYVDASSNQPEPSNPNGLTDFFRCLYPSATGPEGATSRNGGVDCRYINAGPAGDDSSSSSSAATSTSAGASQLVVTETVSVSSPSVPTGVPATSVTTTATTSTPSAPAAATTATPATPAASATAPTTNTPPAAPATTAPTGTNSLITTGGVTLPRSASRAAAPSSSTTTSGAGRNLGAGRMLLTLVPLLVAGLALL